MEASNTSVFSAVDLFVPASAVLEMKPQWTSLSEMNTKEVFTKLTFTIIVNITIAVFVTDFQHLSSLNQLPAVLELSKNFGLKKKKQNTTEIHHNYSAMSKTQTVVLCF